MWTCQRQTGGVVCKHVNEPRAKKCASCGKLRPKKRQPAHRVALRLTYEQYVALNGGEHCAICGAGPPPGRRLDRDHDHSSKRPRGLLCRYHNRLLKRQITLDLARKIVAYLERAESIDFSDPPAPSI